MKSERLIRLGRCGFRALGVMPSHILSFRSFAPISLNLLVTTRCNSRCLTCDSWRLKGNRPELSLGDYQRLALECRRLGVLIVTIGGGEPCLRSDVAEIVRAFSDQGLETQITTNALALTSTIRARLFKAGIHRLTFSIDSHLPEVYARLRGVNGLPRVLETLKATLAERPPGVVVDTNTVLSCENAATFLETLDFLHAMGVDAVNFSAATVSDANYLFTGSKRHLLNIPKELLCTIVEGLLRRKGLGIPIAPSSRFIRGLGVFVEDPTHVVYPCLAGYLTMDIFADGTVYGCGNLPPIGNIHTDPLCAIWHSTQAARIRRAMAAGQCPACYLSCKMEPSIAANPRWLPALAWEYLKRFLP